MMEKVYFHDHFLYGLAEQDWTTYTTGTTSGAVAHSAAVGGVALMTSGTATSDSVELSNNIVWHPTKNCVMEARIAINDASTVCINVGWVDATLGSNNTIIFELENDNGLEATAGVDAAGFVFDTNAGADYWYCAGWLDSAEQAPISIATLPVADTYENLRVALDATGNATFYRNGIEVGYIPTCVSYDATADLMCPYVAVMTRAGSGSRILSVDRITCWQDE